MRLTLQVRQSARGPEWRARSARSLWTRWAPAARGGCRARRLRHGFEPEPAVDVWLVLAGELSAELVVLDGGREVLRLVLLVDALRLSRRRQVVQTWEVTT